MAQKKDSFRFLYYVISSRQKYSQGFYSKLEECNKSFSHSEEFLKYALLKGLSHENKIKVLMDGLQALALDEILESLSPE